MKKSKQVYYNKYLETNWNYIENTWKVMKTIISLKTVASNVSNVLSRGVARILLKEGINL